MGRTVAVTENLVDWSKSGFSGNSLGIQWLGLCTFTAEGPGRGTKNPASCSKKKKKKSGFSSRMLNDFGWISWAVYLRFAVISVLNQSVLLFPTSVGYVKKLHQAFVWRSRFCRIYKMYPNGWKNFPEQQHCLHIHDTLSSKGMSQVGNSACYFQLVSDCAFIVLVFWRFFLIIFFRFKVRCFLKQTVPIWSAPLLQTW